MATIESAAAANGRSRLRRVAGRLLRPALLLGLAAILVIAGAGLDRAGILPGAPGADLADASPQFQLIRQAWDLIHEQYVQRAELDDTSLSHAAVAALANAIGDTGHTAFETPADLAAEQAILSGHYVGIGVELGPASGGAVLRAVYPGSPASRAGLEVDDLIVAVNGRDVAGLALPNIRRLIAGPTGSSLKLTVRPAVGGGSRQITLVRDAVTIPVVVWAMVPGTQIADIQIDQFSSGATTALATALRATHAAGAKGLVLDLRGNPGGLVTEAVGVASQFMASGDVYQTQDASGTRAGVPVQPGGVALEVPLVVLVDHGTASAAEIVAGALQDAHRATIVGEPTFGTGTILSEFSLADGSALRIGTQAWLTRDGRSFWHRGLDPNQVVALPRGERPLPPSELRGSRSAQPADVRDTQLLTALRDAERALGGRPALGPSANRNNPGPDHRRCEGPPLPLGRPRRGQQ